MKKTFIAAMIITGSFLAGIAQTPAIVLSDKPGWHKIAERKANYKADHDEIVVLGNDHFKAVKLKVEDNDINLMSFTLYFENGQMQVINVNSVIHKGTESPVTEVNQDQ